MSNKHTGSSLDSFLEEEGIELCPEPEDLSKADLEFLEELSKSCPRCGKPSANKSNPSGRCRACLNKLATNKKKPGHYLHNHKVADDALRRQRGANGTSHKKSKGLGSRADIIKKVKAGEKKAGTVLSPDRKDNSKGYSSSNTRMVPPKLNRGRHKVDPKKLAAWKKHLKKNGLELDDLKTLMTAHAYDTGREELAKTLELFDDNFLEQFFNDVDDSTEKKNLNKAIPSTKDIAGSYDMTQKGPEFKGYTGSDAKKGQISAVKEAIALHQHGIKGNTKNMVNPMTGQNELHILTHRGIDKNGYDPKKTGPNMLQVGDKHVEQSHHAVHTLNPRVAEEYGDRHSFWVPVSHFVGTSKYINGRFKNPKDYNPTDEDLQDAKDTIDQRNQWFDEYGGNHPQAKTRSPNDAAAIKQMAHESKAYDPHSEEQSHVVVKPGKFHRHTE